MATSRLSTVRDQETLLTKAVRNQDQQLLCHHLEKGVDVNVCNSNGWSPLMVAVDVDDLNIVKILLKKSANPNIKLSSGHTAMHFSAEKGNVRILKQLITHRGEVNDKTMKGFTPLHFAAQKGRLDCAKLLLSRKADVNVKTSKGHSPCHLAAEEGHMDLIQCLVENKADLSSKTASGKTIYHKAVEKNNVTMMTYLESVGCDKDLQIADGSTSLMLATKHGRYDAFVHLLQIGANVNIANTEGHTSMHLVCNSSKIREDHRLEMVKLLLENGADETDKSGESLLDKVSDIFKGLLKDENATFSNQNYSPKHLKCACPYDEQCCNFVQSLQLPKYYFDSSCDKCYCLACHQKSGMSDCEECGVPPVKCAIPVGWCSFGLKLPNRAHAVQAQNKWHRAFHGTEVDKLERILNTDQLVSPGLKGSEILGGSTIRQRMGINEIPEGSDTKKVFMSPSPAYAELYATAKQFTCLINQKPYNARVALQVFVSPESYKLGPETKGFRAKDEICDPRFSNMELEWSTQQLGSIILAALLVKLDEV